MAIPLAYNLRNLAVRKTTTIMTALGIALTVAVLLAVLALVAGLRNAFASTGNPLQVLVMRKGSNSELASNFTRLQYQDLKFKPGIALDDKRRADGVARDGHGPQPAERGQSRRRQHYAPRRHRARHRHARRLEALFRPLVPSRSPRGRRRQIGGPPESRTRNSANSSSSAGGCGRLSASWTPAIRRSTARSGPT